MNHPGMNLTVVMERTADLVPYTHNAKLHDERQIEQICASIEEFGFADPIGVWTNESGESEIVEGHGRVLAAQRLGIDEVPVIHLDTLTDEQRRAYALVHNQLTMGTGWDPDELGLELDLLGDVFDMSELGFDFDFGTEDDVPEREVIGSLSDSFLVPPFTTLVARSKEWNERKRLWIGLGIRSEEGRGEKLTYNIALRHERRGADAANTR